MFRKSFSFLYISLLLVCGAFLQSVAQTAPKRELRAAWIATIANIDWPSKPGLSVDSQKAEYIRILDMLKNLGMNAVVVQIRPAADAFYDSNIEPWSYWLTGVQGLAPAPYYDPLKFMIKEAHVRGMEFHAWFNPYRAVPDIYHKHLAQDNIMVQHPDWFITYGKTTYFNPGLPQVWNYLNKVIDDVVKRYDIDAVQFDDYFYPYRIKGKEFQDYKTYQQYSNGMSIDDWRRHNVDTVIEMLSKSIKQIKPWVKFGISPFGVWRNRDRDIDGSMTQAGQTDYDDLYANVLLWLKKGWIDYVCPQLYWSFGNRYAPYGILLDWWAHHTYGRELVIGQAAYRIGNGAGFYDPREMVNEINANRTYPDAKGSIFFSARSFNTNPLGFDDSLKNDLYKYPAIPPRMPWIDSIPPMKPHLLGTATMPDGLLLQWTNKDSSTTQFVIYRFIDGTKLNFNDPSHILAIVNAFEPDDTSYIQAYTDTKFHAGEHYVYAITALDRLHNESSPSNLMHIPLQLGFSPRELYDSSTPEPRPLPLVPGNKSLSADEGN